MRKLWIALGLLVPTIAYSALNFPEWFVPGTIADADAVNSGFDAVVVAANSHDARLAALEASLPALAAEIDATTNARLALSDTFNGVTRQGDDLVVSGVNLQLVDGSGDTDGVSGVGNLFVGYNELGGANPVLRIGSHNVVLGIEQEYLTIGGVVTGRSNRLLGAYSVLSGGRSNVAAGAYTGVVGGEGNVAALNSSTSLGDSYNRLLIDVTDPPLGCIACTPATADGTTDDVISINETVLYACDQGFAGIYLPEGSYRLGGTGIVGFYSGIMIEASTCPNGLEIVGAGQDRTTLLPGNPNGQYVISSCDEFQSGRYGGACTPVGPNDRFTLRIAHLRIFDDDPAAHSQAIEESHGIGILQSGGQALVEDVLIEDIGDEAIDVSTSGGRAVIRDSRFIDPASAAIAIYQCKGVTIDNVEATRVAGLPHFGTGIDLDPGNKPWVIENVIIQNSSLLQRWGVGIRVRANPLGLVGTEVSNVIIRNNQIEANPIPRDCKVPTTCASIHIASGADHQYARDVLIENNELQGPISVNGARNERIRVLNNRITPLPWVPGWGVIIRGLGSEVRDNEIVGFERGCIQFGVEDTEVGVHQTVQLAITGNRLACVSGDLFNNDPAIGHVGGIPLPPADEDEGYFDISNNHITVAAGAVIRRGIEVLTPFKNVSIRGNVIRRDPSITISGSCGIAASGSPLVVESNQIDGSWTGVSIYDVTRGSVTANQIEARDHAGAIGVEMYDSSHVVVSGNVVQGANATGAAAARSYGSSDSVVCTNNISMGTGGQGAGGSFECGGGGSTVGLGCSAAGVGSDTVCDTNLVGS